MNPRIQILTAVVTSLTASSFGDAVTDWNKNALDAIRADRTPPPKASRALAMTHVAVYDAVNGVAPTHRHYHVVPAAPAGASADAAAIAAAYTVLNSVFTNAAIQSTNFLARYNASLASIPDSPAKTSGIGWGQSVGNAIVALRNKDGAENAGTYTPSDIPGRWKPTSPAATAPLLPSWGQVKPFSIPDSKGFRPQTPPPLETAAFALEFNTIKLYGGTNSTLRTPNQTEVALFWADGAGTVTPPGHWNVIAGNVASAKKLSLAENARLFALLNLSTADAAICCWEAKYAYDYYRPVTAIREAGQDGNPETEADPSWTPLIATPPFPEYTSGHSTFSRSAATALAAFFGTDEIPFNTECDALPGVIRSYQTFGAAADDAGASRLYGGIHFPSGNIHGQAVGFRIGQHTADFHLQAIGSLKFASIASTPGGTQLQLKGEPGSTYLIRASSDLKTWEEITAVSSATGLIQFTDVNAPVGGMRFYDASAR